MNLQSSLLIALNSKDVIVATGEVISQFDFSYDKTGNIIQELVTPPPQPPQFSVPTNLTYGLANRLATYNDQVVQFDADGNMIKGPLADELTDFEFDSRNRLIQAGSTVYRYDAENQRIGVNQTQYVVNSQPALSQVLVRTKGNGEITYYVYGLGLIGEASAGNYFSYHYDLRGSTVALTNESEQVTERFQYSPYGLLLSGDAQKTPFLFNGMYGVMTDESGLYYMRARFYSPEIKRFVNQDILLGNVAEGQTLNRYAYVTGRPVSFVDPFGFSGCDLVNLPGDELFACLFEETFGWIFDLEIFQPGVDPYSDLHVNRNRYNRCPQLGPSESERHAIPFGIAFIDCEGNAWRYDFGGAVSYHGFRDEGNMSYRRSDPIGYSRGFQCVYDPMGTRVTTVPFMGSYDYHAPGFSLFDIIMHRKYDVNTHDINPNYPENPDLTEEYCTCTP